MLVQRAGTGGGLTDAIARPPLTGAGKQISNPLLLLFLHLLGVTFFLQCLARLLLFLLFLLLTFGHGAFPRESCGFRLRAQSRSAADLTALRPATARHDAPDRDFAQQSSAESSRNHRGGAASARATNHPFFPKRRRPRRRRPQAIQRPVRHAMEPETSAADKYAELWLPILMCRPASGMSQDDEMFYRSVARLIASRVPIDESRSPESSGASERTIQCGGTNA